MKGLEEVSKSEARLGEEVQEGEGGDVEDQRASNRECETLNNKMRMVWLNKKTIHEYIPKAIMSGNEGTLIKVLMSSN